MPPHEKPLDTLLQGWLALANSCQKRVFVTDHPELLAEEAEQALDTLIAQASARPDRQQDLCLCRSVLRDARRRGGSAAAIQDACITMYGGFALEVPEWLATLSRQSESLLQQGHGEESTAARAALWEGAEVRAVRKRWPRRSWPRLRYAWETPREHGREPVACSTWRTVLPR